MYDRDDQEVIQSLDDIFGGRKFAVLVGIDWRSHSFEMSDSTNVALRASAAGLQDRSLCP